MKKVVLLVLLLAAVKLSFAQYKPVDKSSTIKFTIKNLGFGVDGSFTGFDGKIIFDPQHTAGSMFDVSIDASSVNTDNSLRDEHLKGDGYFDVKNYPRIHILSNYISATGKSGVYLLTGQLTIKNNSRPVSFPFTAVPFAGGYIFKGAFKINRKDFSIGGSSTIADELEVFLNVTVKRLPDPVEAKL